MVLVTIVVLVSLLIEAVVENVGVLVEFLLIVVAVVVVVVVVVVAASAASVVPTDVDIDEEDDDMVVINVNRSMTLRSLNIHTIDGSSINPTNNTVMKLKRRGRW